MENSSGLASRFPKMRKEFEATREARCEANKNEAKIISREKLLNKLIIVKRVAIIKPNRKVINRDRTQQFDRNFG